MPVDHHLLLITEFSPTRTLTRPHGGTALLPSRNYRLGASELTTMETENKTIRLSIEAILRVARTELPTIPQSRASCPPSPSCEGLRRAPLAGPTWSFFVFVKAPAEQAAKTNEIEIL